MSLNIKDTETHELATALAKATGESMTLAVNLAIRERIALEKQRKSAFEIAQEMGVIGMDDDARRDTASRHPKYVKAALRSARSA